MFFVNGEQRKERIAICRACPVYVPTTGSCGQFLHPILNPNQAPATIDGVTFQPCGCNIAAKATLKISQCPANKWPLLLDAKVRDQIKQIVDDYVVNKRIDVANRKILTELLQKINPNYRPTNCGECVRNELRALGDALNFGAAMTTVLNDLATVEEPVPAEQPNVINEVPPSIAKFVNNEPKKRAKRKPRKA